MRDTDESEKKRRREKKKKGRSGETGGVKISKPWAELSGGYLIPKLTPFHHHYNSRTVKTKVSETNSTPTFFSVFFYISIVKKKIVKYNCLENILKKFTQGW